MTTNDPLGRIAAHAACPYPDPGISIDAEWRRLYRDAARSLSVDELRVAVGETVAAMAQATERGDVLDRELKRLREYPDAIRPWKIAVAITDAKGEREAVDVRLVRLTIRRDALKAEMKKRTTREEIA